MPTVLILFIISVDSKWSGVRMTSHGIIQPNPALYDLESWRPRHVLGHETGHYWRGPSKALNLLPHELRWEVVACTPSSFLTKHFSEKDKVQKIKPAALWTERNIYFLGQIWGIFEVGWILKRAKIWFNYSCSAFLKSDLTWADLSWQERIALQLLLWGGGAACLECGPACPGLQLYYWRGRCGHCHCRAERHSTNSQETLRDCLWLLTSPLSLFSISILMATCNDLTRNTFHLPVFCRLTLLPQYWDSQCRTEVLPLGTSLEKYPTGKFKLKWKPF